jgi:sodium-dependent dicarboxylate transporter 2/3/5
MLAVAALMATWWVSEAVPLAATSLLPLMLFPALGLAKASEAAAPYANHLIYLFMGGFMLAQAMQRWQLHRRLALSIVLAVGTSPERLVLGFMCATAFLSMWVSNTATAAMMMPIGLAVIQQVREAAAEAGVAIPEETGRFHFGAALMLGIAYAASIGGLGTLIGTPPNVLLAGTLERSYGIELSFLRWLVFGVPMVVVFVPLTWLVLTRWTFPLEIREIPGGRALIQSRLAALGRMSRGERRTASVFGLTALAWTFRPFWADWLPHGELWTDSTVAIASALLLFGLPAGDGERLLDWEWAARLPWDVLVLFGGGFALASGFESSGLSEWAGAHLQSLQGAPFPVFVLVMVLGMTLLTEFASNVAATAMALPIVGATALALGVSPVVLCVPAAAAASCAFMLPAATPPNAILFGTGSFTIPQMIRAGLIVDLVGTLLIVAAALYLIPWLFAA